jgi:hypothetical protein
VQRAIAAAEYQASETEGGLQAPNRAHGLRTWFAPTGIRIHDRRIAGRTGLAELSLVGIGRGSLLAPVAAGRVTETATRVEIRRPGIDGIDGTDGIDGFIGIVEWYENSPRGLEQGFTLQARSQGQGSLVLELSVAHARATIDGASVVLTSEAGRRLRYGDLFAEDAEGRLLASRIEVANPHLLRLVVEDAGAVYPIVIDPLITAIPDATLESNIAWSGSFDSTSFGASISGAGDVNGDSYDDVVIGAFGYDNGLFDEGAAFVFHGSATGNVNNDLYDDVLVGAGGYIMVFHGSASGITGTDPGNADTKITSSATISVGALVASAGDVNDDGFDDIMASDPGYPTGITSGGHGAFMVFHGSASGVTATGPAAADTFIEGDLPIVVLGPTQFLGWRFSGAGDVDGDGIADVIVGGLDYAGGLDNEGTAYVFRGSATGLVGTTLADAYVQLKTGQALAAYRSNKPGFDLAAAGDVNGDGCADVLMGAAHYDAGEAEEGAVFVYHGSCGPGGPINQPPVAYAGTDQSVQDADGNGSEQITVDGSGSFDLDGSIASYEWFNGPTLLGTGAVLTTALAATGTHSLALVVTDDAGETGSDTLTVRVELGSTATGRAR